MGHLPSSVLGVATSSATRMVWEKARAAAGRTVREI